MTGGWWLDGMLHAGPWILVETTLLKLNLRGTDITSICFCGTNAYLLLRVSFTSNIVGARECIILLKLAKYARVGPRSGNKERTA